MDLGLDAGDGNCILARRKDFEGLDVGRTVIVNDIIGGARRDDGDGVGVHIHHTNIAVCAFNLHRVLTLRNYTAVVIINGDIGLLLAAVVGECILGQ